MTFFDVTRDDAVNVKSSHSQALGNPEYRLCNAALTTTFVDLGMSPLCESVLAADQIDQMEPYFPLHGGSLRVYLCHSGAAYTRSPSVDALLADERQRGFEDIKTYATFSAQVHQTKRQLLSFLIKLKDNGAKLSGYGAPGKGNTLLNYCGIGTDFLDFTVDRNPYNMASTRPACIFRFIQYLQSMMRGLIICSSCRGI